MSKALVDDRTHEELRAAALAGESITPEMLSRARETDELRALQAEAEQRARQEQARREDEQAYAELRAQIAAVPDAATRLGELTELATEALTAVIEAVQRHNEAVKTCVARARSFGAIQETGRPVTHNSGVGWRRVGGDRSRITTAEGRALETGDPGQLVERIVHDVLNAHRVRTGRHSSTPPPVGEQLAGMDRRS